MCAVPSEREKSRQANVNQRVRCWLELDRLRGMGAEENEKRRMPSCNSYHVNMEECGSRTHRAEHNAVDYG